jgi:hypothetical protein
LKQQVHAAQGAEEVGDAIAESLQAIAKRPPQEAKMVLERTQALLSSALASVQEAAGQAVTNAPGTVAPEDEGHHSNVRTPLYHLLSLSSLSSFF